MLALHAALQSAQQRCPPHGVARATALPIAIECYRVTKGIGQVETLPELGHQLGNAPGGTPSAQRRQLTGDPPEAERAALRAHFFAKSQACLRASPLPKSYGWGLHFDGEGRVALCPMESEAYRRLVAGADGVKVLKAMRSRRA